IKAVLGDPRFSNDPRFWEHASRAQLAPEHAGLQEIRDSSLLRLARSDHARVRKLVSGAFTPRAIERMRGEIQRIVDEVLASEIMGHRLGIRAFAQRIPIRVIGDMLKLPASMSAQFRAYSAAAIRSIDMTLSPEEVNRTLAELYEGAAMVREVIAARREAPL